MWQPTRRTAAAQRFLAHYFFSLFKGEEVPSPLLLRILPVLAHPELLPIALLSTVEAPFSGELAKKFRRVLLRRESPRNFASSALRASLHPLFFLLCSSSSPASSPLLRRPLSSTSSAASG
jgi:hypothetical protein